MFDLQLHQLLKILYFCGADNFEKNFGGKNGIVLHVLAGNYSVPWRKYANLCSKLGGKLVGKGSVLGHGGSLFKGS